jgi:hypothetical protein
LPDAVPSESEGAAGVHNIFRQRQESGQSEACSWLLAFVGSYWLVLGWILNSARLNERLGAVVEYCSVIKRILVRCPTTKKLNVTGVVIEEDVFAATKVKSGTVACSHCGAKHAWNKKQAILAR